MYASPRSRMLIAVQCAALTTALLVVDGIPAQKKEGPEPAEPKAVEVKVTGATLSFVPVDISPRRRSARSEASLLKKATAMLTTRKVLTYRKKELPRGDYRLTLESKDATSWFFLLWPEDAKKKASREGTKTKQTKEGGASRDDVQPALRVPLSLTTIPGDDHRMVFELKLIEKGKRIRIVVRAGSTQLTGALRWKVEPEE